MATRSRGAFLALLLAIIVALSIRIRSSRSLTALGGGVEVLVYGNGESDLERGGEPMSMTREVFDREFAFGGLFGEGGEHIGSYGDLIRLSNDGGGGVPLRVFRGPARAGLQFVWPTFEIGHRVSLDPRLYGDPPRGEREPMVLETLYDSPRVFHVHNFMSDGEIETLIATATDANNPYSLRRSTTGHKSWTDDKGKHSGEKAQTNTRTSENGFDITSSASAAIKRRAFRLLRVAQHPTLEDGIQVLRYEKKQAYIAHHDYFPSRQSRDFKWSPKDGGSNRFATLFLYLSDVADGGQTVFTKAPRRPGIDTPFDGVPASAGELFEEEEGSWESALIDQCYRMFSIVPKKGSAILFYSQHPDGTLDPLSLHGGCPVLNGTKWAANLWVWNACRYGQCGKHAMDPTKHPASKAFR